MKKIVLTLIQFLCIFNISIAQNGLNFDGSNDFVQTDYSGVLNTADRTFEAWIFIDEDAPTTAPFAIIDYGVNIAGSRNTFSVSGSKQLTFISGGGTDANISSPANSILVDRWIHVAFVLEDGTGFLYADGNLVGTGSLTDVDTPADQNLKVGQRVDGGSIPFHGSIDEVRIWNTARSQVEIQENMNKEICSPDPDLQLYLRFNQGVPYGDNATVTEVVDESGNSYIGTLSSFILSDSVSNWVPGAPVIPGFSSGSETISACDSYTWSADSITYFTTGSYSTVISSGNINGCDSLVSLDLTINGQNSSDTTSITTCKEYTWPSNGQTFTATGLYTEMYPSANGCDSLVTLNLTILSLPDNSVTYDGDLTITSNEADASYQWLNCDNDFAAISDATSQSYLAPDNGGNFAVEITTADGCIDTSACITVDGFTSIDALDTYGSITLFPNPTKSNSMLSFGKQISNVKVTITDVLGRRVNSYALKNVKEITIDIEGDAGIYFIQVTDGTNLVVILRLLKE